MPCASLRARIGFALAAVITSVAMLGSEVSLVGLQADPMLIARALGSKPDGVGASASTTIATIPARKSDDSSGLLITKR
jgi:hypothetical protein